MMDRIYWSLLDSPLEALLAFIVLIKGEIPDYPDGGESLISSGLFLPPRF